MINQSRVLKATMLWVVLFVSSVQSDDVSVKNVLSQPAKFRVIIPSTGFDKTISVNPGGTVNPIGTDLWHNAQMAIYAYSPHSSTICAVVLYERRVPGLEFTFFLPQISHLDSYKPCTYKNDFPRNCDCFRKIKTHHCLDACGNVTNSQVVIYNSAGHSEL